MKWLYAFTALFVVVNADDYCKHDVTNACSSLSDTPNDILANCKANFSGFGTHIQQFQAYANKQLVQSFDYLLLAANFGAYVKNRPGFEKQFRELSDTAWRRSIDLMKHITKRGYAHDFNLRFKAASDKNEPKPRTFVELDEINALALALDAEKTLSREAHSLHQRCTVLHKESRPDAEMAHYLEEEFIEDQATTIRKLSGYVNDLKHFLEVPVDKELVDSSLSLYMFDEYLQKQ